MDIWVVSALVNNAAVDAGGRVFLRGHTSSLLLGVRLSSGITRSRDKAAFTLLKNRQGDFRSRCAPPRGCWPAVGEGSQGSRGSSASSALPLRLLDPRHPSGCEVASSWDSIHVPLTANDFEHLFGSLLPT